MTAHDDDPSLTEEEIARRRDEAIKRALNTRPKRQEEYKGKSIRPTPKTKKPTL